MKSRPRITLHGIYSEHRADLEKSGVSVRTALSHGLYSVTRSGLGELLGYPPDPQIKSALIFPYADGFFRAKVFPSYKNKKGDTVKYLQPKGSSSRFYVPSSVSHRNLKDITRLLIFAEGEKKVLAAVEMGITDVLGVGGLWSWLENGAPIKDFSLMHWAGREVWYVPDSDVWSEKRRDLLKPVFAFCKLLEEEGAEVCIVKLPALGTGGKIGLDDFFLTHSPDDFWSLPQVDLSNEIFLGLEDWYADWRNKSEKRNKMELLSLIPPTSKKWIRPLSEKAYYGLVGQFVRLIEPHTEADPVALLGQFLVCFGNLIGRKAHFIAEGCKHFFNLYILLIGQTAKGRKGSAWSQVRRFFELADPVWHNERIKSGLSSGEGLIWAVRDAIESQKISKKTNKTIIFRDDPGVKDKRLLVYESELALVLNVMRRDGNILTTVLRDFWDGVIVVECLTKNNPAKTTSAHVSIVAHVTEEELKLLFRPTDARNGFGNRFLWVCVKRTKLLPEGGNPSKLDLIKLSAKLHGAIRFAKNVNEMQRDTEAAQLWREVYPFLSKERPGIFGGLIGRAEPQVMRIAGIYALLDLSRVIRKPHLEAALAFWDYAENSLLYLYGDSLGDEAANKIVKGLRKNAPGGMTLSEMGDKLFSNHYDPVSLQLTLSYLVSAGFITARERKTQGRPAQEFFATSEGVR